MAVICSRSNEEDYLNKKDRSVHKRGKTSQKRLKWVKIKPQCALSYFISGYNHKLNYYMRMVPNISNLLRHIDNVITKGFIPAIKKVDIVVLKLGSLGTPIFSEKSDFEYSNSKMVTKQLCGKVIQGERQYDRNKKIKETKNKITRTRLRRYHEILLDVRGHMNENQQPMNVSIKNQEHPVGFCYYR